MKYTYRQRQGNAKKMQFRQTQEALKKPIQREREREKRDTKSWNETKIQTDRSDTIRFKETNTERERERESERERKKSYNEAHIDNDTISL